MHKALQEASASVQDVLASCDIKTGKNFNFKRDKLFSKGQLLSKLKLFALF